MDENIKVKRSIRTTLIIGFLIVLIGSQLVIGMSSYFKSSGMLEESKRESARDRTGEVIATVDSYLSRYELVVNSTALNSAVKNISASPENLTLALELFDNTVKSDSDILFMYVGTEDKGMYIKPDSELPADFDPRTRVWYTDAKATDKVIWTEPYVDTATGQLVVTAAKAIKNDAGVFVGVLAADVALNTMSDRIGSLTIGELGYPILVDKSGNIMAHKDSAKIGTPLVTKEILTAMQEGKSEIEYVYEENGEKSIKIATISKVEKTGWTVVVSAYMSEIQDEINSLLFIIVISIALAIVVSIIVVTLITRPFIKNIRRLVEAMQVARTGDLKNEITVTSKDEIGLLSHFFNATIEDLGKLVKSIQGVSIELTNASQNLAATSEEVSASADEVGRTVEDIAKGAQDQAIDAEHGALLARDLSDKFIGLNTSTEDMLNAANELNAANHTGVDSIEYLKEKNTETKNANIQIEKDINELSSKTQDIESILDSISAISVQTNLLALNASIEAARAGDAGRGFAVVAEEIRKLAEESAGSAEKVRTIVSNIKTDSERTVSSMAELKEISEDQNNAVEKVYESFEKIATSYDKIAAHIDSISHSVNDLNSDKEKIVASIENISAVSEETAAASEEVTASMDQQVMAIEEVANSAQTLNEISTHLNREISSFKVE